jgi:hypothetical protein
MVCSTFACVSAVADLRLRTIEGAMRQRYQILNSGSVKFATIPVHRAAEGSYKATFLEPCLDELPRTPLRRSSPMKGIAPVQDPNPVSGAGYKRLSVVGGHSARCISIHRCYKVFGPVRSHTPLRRVSGRIGPWLCTILQANFRESLKDEVRRIPLPRSRVNKGEGERWGRPFGTPAQRWLAPS